MSRDMFLQSAFQFGFLPSKPCLFPLKSSLEFDLNRGKPKFISFPVKFFADRSKFQFCTAARSIIIFTRTLLPCLCVLFFVNQVTEIMLDMLFNTILKISLYNTQKTRRRRKARKEQSRALHDDIRIGLPNHPVPQPTRLGLT